MTNLSASRKFALLDRDGTIIVDKVYLSDPDGIEFTQGAIAGMKLLRDAGISLVLVTNQSGIARGYFSEATLGRIHDRLAMLMSDEGLRLEAIYYCPHAPSEGCACRKPAPGLFERARQELGFALEDAIVIGDSDADMGLAKAAGVPGVRIGRGDGCARDFLEAAGRACALLSSV